MSKEKKPTPKIKPVKANDLTDIMSIKEMVDLEFNIPDASIGGFDTTKEYEKYLNELVKNFERLQIKNSNLGDKMHSNLDMMLIFLSKYPELFAEHYGEINRDMLKWSMFEHIKKCRALIDRIQEIEKELKLDIHHEW